MTIQPIVGEDGRERVPIPLTKLEWGMVRDAIAREHNLALKRKSQRPSERAMYAVALGEVIDAIEAAVPETAP